MTADVVYLWECPSCGYTYSSPVVIQGILHGSCVKAKCPRMVPVPEPVP